MPTKRDKMERGMRAIIVKVTSVLLFLAISAFLYLFALSELPRYVLWPGLLAGAIVLTADVAFLEKAFERK
jgi:hypothetical protein